MNTCSFSQTPSFYHLTTANGLYDNHIRSLAIGKQGFLWIGTQDGLNRYDGHSVAVFTKEKNPELPADLITNLFCDQQNRTWIGTNEGVAWMNAEKKIHRVVLQDTIINFASKATIETSTWGIILITGEGQFCLKEREKKWRRLDKGDTSLAYSKIKAVEPFEGDKTLFVTDSAVLMYDYAQNKIVSRCVVSGILAVCRVNREEIAVGNIHGEVLFINAYTGRCTRRFSLHKASADMVNTPQPAEIKLAANGNLVIATGFNGLITVTPSGEVLRFIHDPVNARSLIGNNTYRIATGAHGEVVVGTSTSGISMYNTNLSQAGFTGFFTDASGNFYDNYTGRMVETADDIIWIGTYDRLIRWDKKSNTSRFYYCLEKEGNTTKRGDIRAMCLDKTGKLWLSIDTKGVACFSELSGNFTKLKVDTSKSVTFKASSVSDMVTDDEGLIWACSNKGVFTIDPAARKANLLTNHPLLQEISGKIVHCAFIDSKKRIWFTTYYHGVYCYSKNSNQLLHYTTKEGLPSDICYMVQEDKKGRYFITTSKGVAVLKPDNSVQTFTRASGLRYDRCESVLIDHENIVWFSNKNCLVRLNMDKNEMDFLDEKAGLLNEGFRVGSCLKTKKGELLWSGYRGISYFYPHSINNTILPLQVSVHSVQIQDSVIDISANNSVKAAYASSSISFGVAGIHLGIPGKTYYQYKLTGFDKKYQKDEDMQQARYTALPPGAYTFELKASIDGVHWVEAERKINVVIVPPLWMRGWFITAAVLAFACAGYWFVKNRNKKIEKQKQETEAEQAINYFASSLHGQQTVETILWDVARNCLGRLQFDDCAVYLLDKEKNALIQKAIDGPGSPSPLEASNPLEIPVGIGVAGAVALTGKVMLVNDIARHASSTAGDKQHSAEIAVPLIWEGKVIGIIDCKHHKKNYFTQKHVSILTTIASLCANKLIRASAEEEKQKAQATLTDTQQKMAEVEMQALRAQMNPHFIFNCLNSINRYIVKSDQATASLYLTRFAKLIRLILDNSGSKNVLLSHELEALKLYIEMEALRFDKKFSHLIIVDRNVNTDSIVLPPLIIQPYVENAIWHGLLHKDDGGQLTVAIRLADESMLECVIEDNGIGRRKALELKSKSATSRKSLGMQLTENRLSLLNRHAELHASILIVDMEDEKKQPAGTKVVLHIPV